MAELDPLQPEIPETVAPSAEIADVVPVETVWVNRPRRVYAGMWGIPEIAAVSVSALVLLFVIVLYFFWVIPSNRELAKNKSDADRLEAEAATAKTKFGDITNSQTQVGKLVTSVDDFETRYLPVISTGQAALYERLNSLISSYDLINTSGPDYAPLEIADVSKPNQQQSDENKGRAKFRSLYPGVYVSTTLEGSYQNLRRFIRELETGRDFIIVSSVELAPSDTQKQKETDNTNGAKQVRSMGPQALTPTFPGAPNPNLRGYSPGANPMNPGMLQGPPVIRSAKQEGKTRGEVVSLHLELAAYFRRPNAAPTGQ